MEERICNHSLGEIDEIDINFIENYAKSLINTQQNTNYEKFNTNIENEIDVEIKIVNHKIVDVKILNEELLNSII